MRVCWDTWNIGHIARHRVRKAEVEEALRDPNRYVARTRARSKNERRYLVVGRTMSGRMLRVILALKENCVYPITAFDATDADRRLYRRKRQ